MLKFAVKGSLMKKETLTSLIFFTALISIGIISSYQRFFAGLPMGIDSPSHMFKILYLNQVFDNHGYIPAWCADWYGGTPFLHFYPPLSYLLTSAVSMLGLGPILAYNIVETFFYIITPLTIYFLSQSLGFKKNQSIIAGLTYSLTPIVLENFLFYDRFTTIISVPLLCLFLISVIKALDSKKQHFLIASCLLMTTIILIHHLTVYALGITLLLLFGMHYLKTGDIKIILKCSVFAVLVPIFLSAFWLFPFINSLFIVDNPFYNRSNVTNFLSPQGLFIVILTLGLQFLLALSEITSYLHRREKGFNQTETFKLLLPSILVLVGSILSITSLETGQIIAILGFTSFLILFFKRIKKGMFNTNFCTIWFLTFLWLSLGFYGVLFRLFPLSQKLDVLRFQLYLSIPQSILTGSFVAKLLPNRVFRNRLYHKMNLWKKVKPLLLVTVLTTILISSFWITKNRTYRSNTLIPPEIIGFLESNSKNGRILPIKCPHWIYVLPYYTEQPLIDGWYPQEKLLRPLLAINDYQINTLNMYEREEQIQIWSSIIDNSSRLGLKWVMIGQQEFNFIMNNHSSYNLVFKTESITIYEFQEDISLLEVDRLDSLDKISFDYFSPEQMILTIENLTNKINIVIKIAYFPGWIAEANDKSIAISETADGFISFSLEPATSYSLNLTYRRHGMEYFWISIIGIVVLLIWFVYSLSQHRTLKLEQPLQSV
jgi:hypothetical protein